MSTLDRQGNNDVADERLVTSGMGLRLELFVEDMGESVSFTGGSWASRSCEKSVETTRACVLGTSCWG